MRKSSASVPSLLLCLVFLAAVSFDASAAACVVPDNGTGTVTLPPAGCGYLGPTDVHEIIAGLPPGTTVQLTGIHRDFVCNRGSQGTPPGVCDFVPSPACDAPGGSLGGAHECADSVINMELEGTGTLAGWSRTIQVPLAFETEVGPRSPGTTPQSFPTQMLRMQGQLPPGDPDFDLLRITAGNGFGLPSPGHTTLTRLGPAGSPWQVDSFFDITYRIDFIGRPGGQLSGMSGSTTATIRMTAGAVGCVPLNCDDGNPCTTDTCNEFTQTCDHVAVTCDDGQVCTDDFCNPGTGECTHTPTNCDDGNLCTVDSCVQALLTPPCTVPDNGGGTVTLPPAGCDYLSPTDVHEIIDGLPPGTTIQLGAIHKDFICRHNQPANPVCSFPPNGVDCDEPGGGLGGEKECSESTLELELHGTGSLNGWFRTIALPIGFETHTGPRTPGDPVQSFDTQMFRLFGQITGDPDFDLLRIVAGNDFGMPSPGHTTLTQQGGGNWAVDSFFDITYRIDFVGAQGGHVAGMSGSTTGTIRMQTGAGVGCVHTPITCPDDGNPCTDEVCDPGTGGCSIVNDDTNTCTDGNACTNDACVNGVCSCPTILGACVGNTKHVDSTDVPKTIPTTAPPNVVTSVLTVTTPDTYLLDIDLRTFITHTANNHIQMTLRSPAGTIVSITTQNGGTLDNAFNGTLWNDDADPGNQVPYTSPLAASNLVTDTVYTNLVPETTLVPEEPLGAFIGENPNGIWTLTIADVTNLEGGSLANWSVDVTTLPAPPISAMATYTSADVPKLIPATAPPNVVSSVVSVSGAGTQVGRVRLNAAVSHTFPGDIDMTLRSPAGTIVTITTDNAVAFVTNVFNGTLWDTKADPGNQVPYTVPNANSRMVTDTQYVTNVVKTTLTSEESLDAFNGEDPNGTWLLTISDDASGDSGALNSWSLEITTTACAVTQCAVVCNDNNPCTDDSCDPSSGCVFTPNTSTCTDGSLCTTGDVCFDGVCIGTPVNCDDNNVCSDDACNPANGSCVHTDNTAPCDDGNECTVGDTCGSLTYFVENFDAVTAPALPAGWTTTVTPVTDAAWTTTTTFAVSALNSATTDTPTHVSDKTLDSPAFVPGVTPVLTFANRYNLEFSSGTPGLGFDGAVLEIQINGGAFTDIVTAGGSFNSGGYTHTIAPNFMSPILSRPAWSANSGGFIVTSVNLPPAAVGQSVVLRWRVASDSTAAAPAPNGQWIDNVRVSSGPASCQPGAPADCDDNNACTDDSCVQSLLPPACIVNDNGGGTVSLPPAGCDYLSPSDVHEIINGLPPGTTIEFGTIHKDFICHSPDGQPGNCSFVPPPGLCEQPGGALGGDQECASSTVTLNLHGTGVLAGWDRTLQMPLQFETAVGPRTPGAPVQSFPTEMRRMFGQITNPGSGDPDFDLLRITAGTDFGMPSPGHTTLRTQGNGTWSVDSFFDITYRIDFVGKPGGHIGGMSGSTTGTIRMATGSGVGCVHTPTDCNDNNPCTVDGCDPVDGCTHAPIDCDDGQVCTNDACDPGTGECTHTPVSCDDGNACTADSCIQALVTPACTVPDNGGGTVTLPPVGCDYLSPQDVHEIVAGLPPGTTIEFGANHRDFVCGGAGVQSVCSFPTPPGLCDQPGGTLGGRKECANSSLTLDLHGTGTLAGWDRVLNIPVSFETHVGPRTPGAPFQSFPSDMFRLFGQITGDPDFDLLRVTAGTDFGLPSPGHTTLTQNGANWNVDSFFDITYRIDFVGAAGGHVAGMSGSTTATIRMQTGAGVGCIHTQIVCNDNNVCTDDACDTATGCFTTNNTAACDDSNPCTDGDICAGGNCTPGAPVPPPNEATNLQAPNKTTYTWNATPGATQYDVLRGAVGLLPVGPGGGDESCFNDLPGPTVNDPMNPAVGGAFFYLSRGQSACGTGTYGTRSNGAPRLSTTCP